MSEENSMRNSPTDCPNCAGEREWARPGYATCFFCGLDSPAKEKIGNTKFDVSVEKRMYCTGIHSEYPGHPREDWRYKVANGDTNLGYWEWVEHREEDSDATACHR